MDGDGTRGPAGGVRGRGPEEKQEKDQSPSYPPNPDRRIGTATPESLTRRYPLWL